MTKKETGQMLDGFVNNVAKSIGFKRIKDQRYYCSKNDVVAQLSFPWHLSSHGTGLFTVWIGLRYESVAHWFDEGDDNVLMTPVSVMPIHFLRKDRTFTEWEFSNANDLENLRSTILDDIKIHAFPHIEHYSRLSNLKNALESKNKEDWFSTGLNVDSRVTVLAAIQLVEGDKAGAIKILDNGIKMLKETLADRPHELRKRIFAMEYLRDRLVVEDKER
jgi:hypothetical protein